MSLAEERRDAARERALGLLYEAETKGCTGRRGARRPAGAARRVRRRARRRPSTSTSERIDAPPQRARPGLDARPHARARPRRAADGHLRAAQPPRRADRRGAQRDGRAGRRGSPPTTPAGSSTACSPGSPPRSAAGDPAAGPATGLANLHARPRMGSGWFCGRWRARRCTGAGGGVGRPGDPAVDRGARARATAAAAERWIAGDEERRRRGPEPRPRRRAWRRGGRRGRARRRSTCAGHRGDRLVDRAAHRRQGVATAAATLAGRLGAPTELGLTRSSPAATGANPGSVAVAERAGAMVLL